ncbi:MAG: hypothetical protein JO108_25865 [Acidobacteriaceae bacterium]|nr:hypothetical protein [Acidobacteriaceae bacterium]
MKSVLIQLDEKTLVALNRVAAPDKRKRSEFIRQAIRKASAEPNIAPCAMLTAGTPIRPWKPAIGQYAKNSGVKQFAIWWVNLPAAAGRTPVQRLSRNDAYQYPISS